MGAHPHWPSTEPACLAEEAIGGVQAATEGIVYHGEVGVLEVNVHHSQSHAELFENLGHQPRLSPREIA
jgi:hypothetical protein